MGVGAMAAVILIAGALAFERVLQWSNSEKPMESLGDGAETLREMEAAMGEEPAPSGIHRQDPMFAPGEEDRQEDRAQDTGRMMNLERLTDEDLAFLKEILEGDAREPRLSATRALIASAHPAGVGLLFDAAARGGDDAALFCLGALDIARVQLREFTLRSLLLALLKEPPLPSDCRAEISDRFSLLGGQELDTVLLMAGDTDPQIRAWAARVLADETGAEIDQALVALAGDPELSVRARAWVAWSDRDITGVRPLLTELVAREPDPELAEQAQEILSQ